jgi:outer membrane protein insertion porin family
MKDIFKGLFLFSIILIMGSCQGTRHLAENESLYVGARVKIESQDQIPNKSNLKDDLRGVITPQPNTSVFGLRPQVWIYNIMGEPKKDRGLRNWIRNNIGEPPVLLRQVNPDKVAALMHGRLLNNGHFHPHVDYAISTRNKKSEITYTATIQQPYRIKNVFYPENTTPIEEEIARTKDQSLVREGEIYNLQTFIEERERIDQILKDLGYYNFSPAHLLFQVDSTVGNREVNVYLTLKEDIPREAKKVYKINNIYVNSEFNLVPGSQQQNDTTQIHDVHFISRTNEFRPHPILRSVFLQSGAPYSRRNHSLTVSRLMGLGPFSFANIRYRIIDTTDVGIMDAHINLTPLNRKSLRAELIGSSKSNYFVGPQLIGRFTNRNAFKGAELFQFNLTAGFETLFGMPDLPTQVSYEFGANATIQLPRLASPIDFQAASRFVPKTNIRAGYHVLNRVNFFLLNSFNANFGYNWRETMTSEHRLNPININYVHVPFRSDAFNEVLERNQFLQRSFEDQFILGSSYAYTYNTQLREVKNTQPGAFRRQDLFFNTTVDLSGNSLFLLQNLVNPGAERYRILGIPYSQFTRLDFDTRYYYRTGPYNQFATRLLVGAGIPYGNSLTMPFVKQFFIGGPYSIRAFPARGIGPGTYVPPTQEAFFFFDQMGDIRLEGNIEYRFDILAMLKGAVFLDAGNIWHLRENPDRPEGTFRFNTFLNQLAIGTGFGTRLDVDFFVLRFDIGVPLRRPDTWVIDQLDFRSLMLNIAIGYPF